MAKKSKAEQAALAAAPVVVVHAMRGMWRAGRAWNAGRNELTQEQFALLGDTQREALENDPNFTLAIAGGEEVTVIGGDAQAIDAHTVVMATRGMYRAGRKWAAGANPLTADQVAELGDKLVLVRTDPNFTVIAGAPASAPDKAA